MKKRMKKKTQSKTKIFTYWIDISGACNLRCPSCPSGNFLPTEFRSGARNPTGFMEFELFEAILAKIRADDVSYNPQIHLYNWGEPLLHPEVGRFVATALRRGFYCGVSSNLNLDRNLEDVVAAGPDYFRISLSGFDQETYGRTHRKGNIETVKANMRKLRALMTRHGQEFYCEVLYHVYRDNAGADMAGMIALCDELKFRFGPVWAYFMPAEKTLEVLAGSVSESDRTVLELLAIPPVDAVRVSLPFRDHPCDVQQRTMAINFDGSVQLCCNTYDRAHVIALSFLDVGHDELQERKHRHPLCDRCIAAGVHMASSYGAGPALDEVGNRALEAARQPYRLHQFGEPTVEHVDTGPVLPTGWPESRMTRRKPVRGLRALAWKLGLRPRWR